MKIQVGIAGYGNVGRGVETVLRQTPDMELAAVFTRRDPNSIRPQTPGVPVYALDAAVEMTGKLDVMILCGGSAKDLPEQGPKLAALFNAVDSFDTHAVIPEYLAKVNAAAKKTAAVISSGWDPGLFSIARLLAETVLPKGETAVFWGRGVSQGHSDAIRRVEGVKNAVQYTVPREGAVQAARSGAAARMTAGERHIRECYVVPEEGADLARIETEIKSMPHYFLGYETSVTFITGEELREKHAAMPHAGLVVRGGETGAGTKHQIEYSLKLDSNPEFTASVLVACARAAVRLAGEGNFGAKTVFDIPLSYLSPKDGGTLVRELL